jgi:hypothetical protein
MKENYVRYIIELYNKTYAATDGGTRKDIEYDFPTDYSIRNPGEFLADGFSFYFTSESSKEVLKKVNRELYLFIENFLSNPTEFLLPERAREYTDLMRRMADKLYFKKRSKILYDLDEAKRFKEDLLNDGFAAAIFITSINIQTGETVYEVEWIGPAKVSESKVYAKRPVYENPSSTSWYWWFFGTRPVGYPPDPLAKLNIVDRVHASSITEALQKLTWDYLWSRRSELMQGLMDRFPHARFLSLYVARSVVEGTRHGGYPLRIPDEVRRM